MTLKAISSMATRLLLNDLAADWRARTGRVVSFESVGGVDAAKRVRAGEIFDVVALADDALAALERDGLLRAGSRRGYALSAFAAATPPGTARLSFPDEASVRAAVLSARAIGWSTGPSGTHLLTVLKRWGIEAEVASRMIQAKPGIPVGAMIAAGEVDLGFQQYSELAGVAGIVLAEPLPAPVAHRTVFAAAIAATCTDETAARDLVDHLASADTMAIKTRHGMEQPV